MWVARDKNRSLWLFKVKPYRNYSCWVCDKLNKNVVGALHPNKFPDLKWEDEPIEVELIRKKRK